MSNFGKHQIQRVMDSAASIAIQKYMKQDDAEKLAALRESLKGHKVSQPVEGLRH